ncbi:branched-chain amino acid aminotransferase [Tahibacter sp. UC22_41]|uniref:branched-chain amino acid aminotransferase n=1 Tax=Tahibacter sp. UC22_41 TaxID=3350178 RepID=UPI0036DD0515
MDAVYWHDGSWTDEHRPLLGLGDNSFWMGNSVFDGARAYEGVIPDLQLHCERVCRSAIHMLMRPTLDASTLADICRDGVRRFERDAELYIRPMFYARAGFIVPEPDSTECAIMIHRAPMPRGAFSACSSPFRRPGADMAPTAAKASCLYPMTQQALRFARQQGFDNALVCNGAGDVVEFATSNLMIVRGGTVCTPVPDGSFLAGITRARVIGLLRRAGVEVVERRLSLDDVLGADEVFSTGNYGKVLPVDRIDRQTYAHGPITQLAQQRYHAFAHGEPAVAAVA